MKRLPFTPEMFDAWTSGRKTVTRRLRTNGSPYYKEGEIVRVVTTWRVPFEYDHLKPLELPADVQTLIGDGIVFPYYPMSYLERTSWGKPRAPRFLPVFLEYNFPLSRIVSVRLEHLQDITNDEAIQEGASRRSIMRDYGTSEGWCMDWSMVGQPSRFAGGIWPRGQERPLMEGDVCLGSPVSAFANLWDTIHDKPGERWDDNPAVWRIEIKKMETT